MQQYLEKALVTLELTGASACYNFLKMAEAFFLYPFFVSDSRR